MTLALAALLPLVGLAVWTFVRFRPRSGSAGAVRAYNVGVLLVAVAGGAWAAAHFYRTMAQSADRAWWPVLATLASLLVVSGVLLAGTALRNFGVFAGRRRR